MIKIIDNWIIFNERKTGRIFQGTYRSVRIPDKHFHVMSQSYPISVEILNWLKEHDINDIEIIEQGKEIKHFKFTVGEYLKGMLIHEEPFGEQRGISI